MAMIDFASSVLDGHHRDGLRRRTPRVTKEMRSPIMLVRAEVQSSYIIRVAIALRMIAACTQGGSVIRNASPIRRAHPRFVEHLLGTQIGWAGVEN